MHYPVAIALIKHQMKCRKNRTLAEEIAKVEYPDWSAKQPD